MSKRWEPGSLASRLVCWGGDSVCTFKALTRAKRLFLVGICHVIRLAFSKDDRGFGMDLLEAQEQKLSSGQWS